MDKILRINKDFKNLAQPCLCEEMLKLEESLLKYGCIEPIIIWDGVILDGHKRYSICRNKNIAFEVQEKEFASDEEAVTWICGYRIGKFDKKNQYHRYLIGKLYIAQKIINKRLRMGNVIGNGCDHDEKYIPGTSTCVRVAKMMGTSRAIVESGNEYAEAMQRIADKDIELFEAILRGDAYKSYSSAIEMSYSVGNYITENGEYRHNKSAKALNEKRRNGKNAHSSEAKINEVPIKTGIKDMPAFDPDMELKGLMLTIPTWKNFIMRVEKKTDMRAATEKAKNQLKINLISLKEQIDHMLETIIQNSVSDNRYLSENEGDLYINDDIDKASDSKNESTELTIIGNRRYYDD